MQVFEPQELHVSATMGKLMPDPIPDIEFKVWLVLYGYQVDTYVNGKRIAATCRDYSGEAESRQQHTQIIIEEINKAFDCVRERFSQ